MARLDKYAEDSIERPGMLVAKIFFFILFLGVGGSWLVSSNDYLHDKFFGPRQEAVRRETFEESKAYNQGMIQNLEKMQIEYVAAQSRKDAASMQTLGTVILQQSADYNLDDSRVPNDLRVFVHQLKIDRGLAR